MPTNNQHNAIFQHKRITCMI